MFLATFAFSLVQQVKANNRRARFMNALWKVVK
jgi:hypothetical protein